MHGSRGRALMNNLLKRGKIIDLICYKKGAPRKKIYVFISVLKVLVLDLIRRSLHVTMSQGLSHLVDKDTKMCLLGDVGSIW